MKNYFGKKYIARINIKSYWWPKINIIITYNNSISKITNLLDDTKNQPSNFRTNNWVEINDESNGRYDNSNIILEMPMIRSNVCEFCDS